MKRNALFLDRDGVINIDKKYVYKIEDFEFCDGIFELCEFFLKRDFLIFIITNQSGIARKYYKEEDFQILSSYMLNKFLEKNIKIKKIYHCPHLENCDCRKPKPGMLLKAKEEFNIDMEKSFFIGDNITDMQAGINAKVGNLFLISDRENDENVFKNFKNLIELLGYLKDKK